VQLWRTYLQLVFGGLALFALISVILLLIGNGVGGWVFVSAAYFWIAACVITGALMLVIAAVQRRTGPR
jgi:hypothetical protein